MTFRPKKPFRRYRLPVLAQGALDAYLGRTLDDFDFLKSVSHPELLAEAQQDGFEFHTPPWDQQLVCFLIGQRRSSFMFYLDPGGGKTKIAVDLFRYRKRRGEATCGLILVPELMHLAAWDEQIPEHAPEL